jgi:hypothetical protein
MICRGRTMGLSKSIYENPARQSMLLSLWVGRYLYQETVP